MSSWRAREEHLLDNRLQALAADMGRIAVAVWVNTLPRLQRGDPWYVGRGRHGHRHGEVTRVRWAMR
ncbi:hypothetical protein [Streptomyces pratensis]|jgi:hypothetical protein|uniref:hypothetical protein n=1 Tax=Streptomyces pratensis TaxID=1169025 RepID=UPI0036310915